MRALTNKELIVLQVLRDHGEQTVLQVVERVRELVRCSTCDGTGKVEGDSYRCHACYGWGHVSFGYSDAYALLKRLLYKDLVARRNRLDEFGDKQRTYVWWSVDAPPTDDPLEQAFHAPAAEK